MQNLSQYIRSIPDFPKPGIIFRDITTLIENGDGFHVAVQAMTTAVKDWGPVDKIAAPEARGFVFGAPLAASLGAGLILMRKRGKLPCKTVSTTYELEYGTDELHIHADSIKKGDRILLVDDLLATGGTMDACRRLIEDNGGIVVGFAFVIELTDLAGRQKLGPYPVSSLITFEGE
ncbi:MAG: adenine phosphoribosyltransferase [Planctomycetia bacterium]|nr:adenine phosphoribosyltransferase [Planctomycetia bacterium]